MGTALRRWMLALLPAAGAAAAESPRRLPATSDPAPPQAWVEPAAYEPLVALAGGAAVPGTGPRYEVGAEFDKGLFLRGVNPERDPYALYVGGRLQLRHTGFVREEESWTDSAGVTRAIRNRNNFDAERVRLNFQGLAGDPHLSYQFILDGDSDDASAVDFLSYYFTYAFDPAVQVRAGRAKASSDREWLLSSRLFTLADRSMATEFFRAGFTDGVWLLGDLDGGWRYETSLTNGLRTSNREASELDDNLAVAGTLSWDPLGPYGPDLADYDNHESPVARLGVSGAFEKSDDRADVGRPLGDDNFLQLSDGTFLADEGALGPGSRVIGDRLLKASLDAAVKWRGWSVTAEWFVRSIQDLTATGPLVVSQVDDHGFRVDAGVFLVPQRFDVVGRVSSVNGSFGDAYEYAGGCNWYWGRNRRDGRLDDRINKLTLDVTYLDGSPVTTTLADIAAGDAGVLLRTQLQVGF